MDSILPNEKLLRWKHFQIKLQINKNSSTSRCDIKVDKTCILSSQETYWSYNVQLYTSQKGLLILNQWRKTFWAAIKVDWVMVNLKKGSWNVTPWRFMIFQTVFLDNSFFALARRLKLYLFKSLLYHWSKMT